MSKVRGVFVPNWDPYILFQVKVFGRVYPIPRQQSAYGDQGVVYTYSGTRIPALAWSPTLGQLRDTLETIAGVR